MPPFKKGDRVVYKVDPDPYTPPDVMVVKECKLFKDWEDSGGREIDGEYMVIYETERQYVAWDVANDLRLLTPLEGLI